MMKKRMAVILAIMLLAVSAVAGAEDSTEQAGQAQGQTQIEAAGSRMQNGGRQNRQGPGKKQSAEPDAVSGATQTREKPNYGTEASTGRTQPPEKPADETETESGAVQPPEEPADGTESDMTEAPEKPAGEPDAVSGATRKQENRQEQKTGTQQKGRKNGETAKAAAEQDGSQSKGAVTAESVEQLRDFFKAILDALESMTE